jgi:hypothetical protein
LKCVGLDGVVETLEGILLTPLALAVVWVPKLCSQRGIIRICRRNRLLTPHTDDAEKLRA